MATTDESNSTAGAVRVDANLHNISCKCMTRKCLTLNKLTVKVMDHNYKRHHTFCAGFHYFQDISTLKIEVKVTEYNIRSDAIRWRISTSTKVVTR